VAAVRAAGYRVLPIPGASSLTAAVSASGLVDEALHFHAFAPSKGAVRKDFYTALCGEATPQVWFEAPHRMEDACAQLAALAPHRSLCIARELTKQFEQITTMPAADAPAWLAAKADHGRGEFVLILGPAPVNEGALLGQDAQALALAQLLVSELPASKAAALAAKHYGADRSAVYAGLLAGKAAAN
jgi:16S rRNA (cytidine1402-2'-O)-methyltransferase